MNEMKTTEINSETEIKLEDTLDECPCRVTLYKDDPLPVRAYQCTNSASCDYQKKESIRNSAEKVNYCWYFIFHPKK